MAFHPVPVTLPLAEIVARLNELQAPFLFGYPSMLTRLAGEQQAGRLRIAPLGVNATSETLLPAYAAAVSSAFGAPVVNTFATTEGLVGVSDPGEVTVTVASDGVQSDRPTDLGALRVRLRSALTLAGLSDPDVSIRAVPALPRDPETGKLRRFIPV